MKIGNSAENTLVTNVQDTNRSKFKIQATGKAFSILSNALYQHKVKAVVREIGCNAYDAHIDAGTTSTPFLVSLPCKEDPHFTVRDFGIGLAEDKFVEIYTTYFGSSKADSNDHTGGLGLGSKTPFIMSKSFTVHSYYNGIDYMWHSFVNDNGEPDVMMLHSKPTTEPNGLKVIVPIGQGMGDTEKVALFRDFKAEAEIIYQWFDTPPTVTVNGTPVNIKKKLTGTKYTPLKLTGVDNTTVYYWGDQDKTAQGQTILVKMGNVVYPYDLKAVRSLDRFGGNIVQTQRIIEYITGLGRLNPSNQPIVVEVGMGDVDIAPSREALSLSNTTELTIINSIVRFADMFFDAVQNQIDTAKTTYEKYQALYLVPSMAGRKFTIAGKEVDPHKQTPTWLFGSDKETAGRQDRALRWFDTEDLVIKYRRAGTRGLLPLKTHFNMDMYGPGVKTRTVILVDTVYKGELRLWVNANAQADASVVVVFGEDVKGGKSLPRPLTAAEMAPFLEDNHPQVVKFSSLKNTPVLTSSNRNTGVSIKVSDEDVILLQSTSTSYNYFTMGNSKQVKLQTILDEFKPTNIAPVLYLALQKKGDKVLGELNNEDPKTPGTSMVEMGYWSRAQGNSTNWQAGTEMIYEVTRRLPDRLGVRNHPMTIGGKKYTLQLNSSSSSHNIRQVLLSAESYAEYVDKPEYPHIYSVDRMIREIFIPMMPVNTVVTSIDSQDTFISQHSNNNIRAFLHALDLGPVIHFMNDLMLKTTKDTSVAISNVKDNVLFKKHGYNKLVTASVSTFTYSFPRDLFHKVCSSIPTPGSAELLAWLTRAGSKPFDHFNSGGYYNNTSDTVAFIGRWLKDDMQKAGFDHKAYADAVVQYLETNKKVR